MPRRIVTLALTYLTIRAYQSCVLKPHSCSTTLIDFVLKSETLAMKSKDNYLALASAVEQEA
jgi:hypothetical protein